MYTTQIFSELGGFTMAAKNDVLFLVVFAIMAAVAAFLVVKHEGKKRFEAELRAAAKRRNKR